MSNLAKRVGLVPSVFRDDFLFPIQREFDTFFNEFFGSDVLDGVRSGVGYPKMDVVVEDGKFVVKAAIPGVNPDDVCVEILPDNQTVRVSGSASTEYKTSEDAVYYVRELHKSKFSRDIRLPEGVSGEPDAQIKDGFLTLKWDYAVPQAPKPKKIEVKKS